MTSQYYKGFSLVELLIVLALISMTLLIVIPTFQHLVERNRTVTSVNRLVRMLRYARISAIHSREIISLCPYLNNKNCGDDWSQGIAIFSDPQGEGQLSTKTTLLRIMPALKQGQLSWNRKARVIQMLPTGVLKGQNGTFSYEPKNNRGVVDESRRRAIIISKTGRIRVKRG